MIKKGNRVNIKPEWQDEGDSAFVWIALDDEDKGRVTIGTPDRPMAGMIPHQTVRVDMLEVQ